MGCPFLENTMAFDFEELNASSKCFNILL